MSFPTAKKPQSGLNQDALQWRDFEAGDFRILIANDLEDTRFVLRRALTIEGFKIDEATNGEELLEVARETPPDLMIVDIMMPRLDGLSALAEIRKDPALAHAYIILLTGKSSVNEKIEGFQLGADDYVTKPYSLGELKARVKAGIRLKSLHRHLMESQQILIRQEKLATIGVLAAGVAHEFNNIMSGISGYAQLARGNGKFVDRLIEVALEQSDRAQKITSSLATFAGSASGSASLVRPRELVDSAACLLHKELRRQVIDFSVDVPEELAAVRVNAGQVQQALVHIILNAIQAAGRDGENGRIEIRASQQLNKIRLEIDDSGQGIPEEDRHRVFDPFFTTKGALGNSTEPGTGLGLTFALNIATSHEGTLDIVDSPLGGTCVRLELPMAEAPVLVAAPADDSTPGSLPNRVVLGEDDESIQEVVAELLHERPPVIFETGEAILDHCRANEVDVVILDITLRGRQSGWEVLDALHELEAPPPVILTSGSLSILEAPKLDYPNLWILPKPFRLRELERVLSKIASGDHAAPTEPA